jgi:hypothetical protein
MNRKVSRYVDACREVQGYRDAMADDPGDSQGRVRSLNFAVARKVELQRALNGAELGQANKVLIADSMNRLGRALQIGG